MGMMDSNVKKLRSLELCGPNAVQSMISSPRLATRASRGGMTFSAVAWVADNRSGFQARIGFNKGFV